MARPSLVEGSLENIGKYPQWRWLEEQLLQLCHYPPYGDQWVQQFRLSTIITFFWILNLPLTHCQSPAWTFLQLNISREIRLWLRTDPWTWQVVTSTLSLSPSCNEGLRQIVVSNGSGIVIRLSESQFVFSIRSCWFYFQFLVVPSSDPLPSPPHPSTTNKYFLWMTQI